MKILITGICGFVGSRLASALAARIPGVEVLGLDSLLRPGSEMNRHEFKSKGIQVIHGDVRMRSDIDGLPSCDWVIDAAANPSVLAGVDGKSSPRQLAEHNLGGTLNVLEYCREHRSGLVLLSTSRVYSVKGLASIPIREEGNAFVLDDRKPLPFGLTAAGVAETFPVTPPISLYGATKLSSEFMALEYGLTFNFPVWVNRCGVLAGAGQFGTAEQGIFSYWIHAYAARLKLRYIGYGGSGLQVRDAFHPDDLADLICRQISGTPPENPIYNVSGGPKNSMSLAQLTAWCQDRFGSHPVEADTQQRPFDIPWMVLDHRRASGEFKWTASRTLPSILDEIAEHVQRNPEWLRVCGVM